VNNNFSYRLSGADRFQLFFDSVARKNTGTGNVIRAAITVNGIIPESGIRQSVSSNEAIAFLNSLSLDKKWYAPLYRFVQTGRSYQVGDLLTFHKGENPWHGINAGLTRDCSLFSGAPVHIDVVYGTDVTHVIFSASHVLMDYAGMENLLATFTEMKSPFAYTQREVAGKSFAGKFMDAIHATSFVASLSSRNMRRLKGKRSNGKPLLCRLELTAEETQKVKLRAENDIKVNALSFFLGCSVFALSHHEELLTGNGNYFIAVPVERRPAADKNVLLSNYLSFIYFQATQPDAKNVKDISADIFHQMISQAKKNIPGKFASLLDLFRFIPAPVYRAFIDLPGNGHSGTFAFSLLTNSRLEDKTFMGFPVIDVTHYAPVISPPGLNIVFTEFGGRLKIILSFDGGRISATDATRLLNSIRKNLLG